MMGSIEGNGATKGAVGPFGTPDEPGGLTPRPMSAAGTGQEDAAVHHGPLIAALENTGRPLEELLAPCPATAPSGPESGARSAAGEGTASRSTASRSAADQSTAGQGAAGARNSGEHSWRAPTDNPAHAPTPWPAVPQLGAEVWDGVGNHDRQAILAAARQRLGNPWPQLLATHYARYWRDGNRTQYEERLGEIRHRLALATLAALLGPVDEREVWLDEVTDGVMLLCEATTWCWAAHERFATAAGAITPSPDRPFIDLGAGEAVGELAWVHYVLGAALQERSPGVRARIVREARARVLDPFRTQQWGWRSEEGREHNWNPWIHSNILIAALLLEDVPAHRAQLVHRVLRGLDRYLLALPADGGIDEGYSYWWQGVGRCLDAVDQVAAATGGAVRITEFAPLVQAARFPYRMQWSHEWFVNVADGSARPSPAMPWHVMHRWGRAAGDPAVRAFAASYRQPGAPSVDVAAGLGRALVGLSDAAWATCQPEPAPLPPWVWLPDTQVAVARPGRGAASLADAPSLQPSEPAQLGAATQPGAPGLGFALKGGHNAENHNHCDVGTVTVALDGVPYVVDAGQPTYTAQTFSKDRYSIWVMQSDWHSVPQPCGVSQSPGQEFTARSMGFAVRGVPDAVASAALDTWGADAPAGGAPADVSAHLDLAGAYALPGLTSWQRQVHVDGARTQVTITDTAEVAPGFGQPGAGGSANAALPGSDIPLMTVHYLLAGQVRLAEPGCIHVTGPVPGGRTLRMAWDPALATASLERRDLDDPLLIRVWGDHLTRLTLSGAANARALRVTCTALPDPAPAAPAHPGTLRRREHTTRPAPGWAAGQGKG